jgi:L-serine dehydratase
VENAAETGMEHNSRLTCDPSSGLVQIPSIGRNAIGTVKAINAAHLSLCVDGVVVPLGKLIKTMRQAGADMLNGHKGTSRGGLAIDAIEC